MSEQRRLKRDFARRQCKLSLRAARAQGCTCEPDALVEWNTGEIPLVHLRHDDWCPLLRVMQEREPAGRYQALIDFDSPYQGAP